MVGGLVVAIIIVVFLLIFYFIKRSDEMLSKLKIELKSKTPLLKVKNANCKTRDYESTELFWNKIDLNIYSEGLLLVYKNSILHEYWYYNEKHKNFINNAEQKGLIHSLEFNKKDELIIIGSGGYSKMDLMYKQTIIIKFSTDLKPIKEALAKADLNYKIS
ncbi:MAG: hypothetical protein JNL24_02120 [Bacteroidia bacterium]|nr:hypothetical protein [Bacteroidia bacterium]